MIKKKNNWREKDEKNNGSFCVSGGELYLQKSADVLLSSLVTNNRAKGDGAALFAVDCKELKIQNSIITGKNDTISLIYLMNFGKMNDLSLISNEIDGPADILIEENGKKDIIDHTICDNKFGKHWKKGIY